MVALEGLEDESKPSSEFIRNSASKKNSRRQRNFECTTFQGLVVRTPVNALTKFELFANCSLLR